MVQSYKRHPLSRRFHELLKEMGQLHDKKQQDYGNDEDPFKNINAAKDWGVEPWIAALMRLGEKVERLKSLAKKGKLANESGVDSMNDIAVYALIARLLYENRIDLKKILTPYVDYANFSDLVLAQGRATKEITKHGRSHNKAKRATARKRARRN
jgi:hypothetical protein